MSVAIIDYGSGNLHSAAKAFERAAKDSASDAQVIVTSNPDELRKAERIVLPGVGAFKDCREGLRAVPGMWETLDEQVLRRGKPFFGICVGMQLMASRGLEHDISLGFGWIPGDVRHIETGRTDLKIPHMGWNTLDQHRPHPLLDSLPLGPDGLHAYFVHSYQLEAARPEQVIATAPYGIDVTAVVARDNLFGTQFHPEKSQKLGLAVISRFLTWRP